MDITAPLGSEAGIGGCVDYPFIPTLECWSQLSPAFESQLWTSPAPPTSHSVISCGWLEIGHGGRVYTTEIGKCYKAGLPSSFGKPAVTHLPAHLWVHSPGLVLLPRGRAGSKLKLHLEHSKKKEGWRVGVWEEWTKRKIQGS